MARYRRSILLDGPIPVKSTAEWHSKGIPLRTGDIVTVQASAPGKFYAEFVPRATYFRRVGSAGGSYPFEVGSARHGWTDRVVAEVPDDWFLVFRVSFFDGDTTINAKIERLRPID